MLDVNGSTSTGIRTAAGANVTHTITDSTIILSLTGAQTLTLLSAASFPRMKVTISNPTSVAKTIDSYVSLDATANGTLVLPYNCITLQSNGANWLQIMKSYVENPQAATITIYTASGTFTPPNSYYRYILVEMIGGGGGAASIAAGTANNSLMGASGGSGGIIKAVLTKAQAGLTSITVTIGNGGAAGTAGGNTTFGAFLTAGGGGAGTTTDTLATGDGVTAPALSGAGGTFTISTGTNVGSTNGYVSKGWMSLSTTRFSAYNQTADTPFGNGSSSRVRLLAITANSTAGVNGAVNSGCGGLSGKSVGAAAAVTGGSGGSGFCRVTTYF
jgi:hypothetical protein